MAAVLGRQPILDQNGVTYGYELLYRSNADEAFSELYEDEATSTVINNSFYQTEIGAISSGKKSFINFTSKLILDEIWSVLPKQNVVIELMDTIVPNAELIQSVRNIKNQGYTIALDDITNSASMEQLVEFADIIKIDVKDSDPAAVQRLAEKYLLQGKKVLAEKVETLKEYKDCRDWGFTLFQGYFFAEPQIVESQKIPESRASKLQLMQQIHQPDIDYGDLVDVLKSDPGLTMKLLKYINSVSMGVRHEITNLRQALALIGLNNFKKWATVLIMSSISDDKPRELMRLSLYRGRFCELLSDQINVDDKSSEYFLTGIFSLMDAAFNTPMERLVEELPLADEIIETLLGNETKLQIALQLSQALEQNQDLESRLTSFTKPVSMNAVYDIHKEAIAWTDLILKL